MKRVQSDNEKFFNIQRRVVSHMVTESWNNIPHVSYQYEPDITDFYAEYQTYRKKSAESGGKSITWNTLMLYCIAQGLKAAPELNAHVFYNHKKGEGLLAVRDAIHISIPWMTKDGRMITPVLENVETMSLRQMSEEMLLLREKIDHTNIDELLYRAVFEDTLGELKRMNLSVFRRIVAGKVSFHRISGLRGAEKKAYYQISEQERLTSANLLRGTVTVSNIGSLYPGQKGEFSLLEIIPPQIFAVGLGAVQEKPGVYSNSKGEKTIGIRKVLPMCLAFDHRAVDFNSLVPFLKKMDDIFALPKELFV